MKSTPDRGAASLDPVDMRGQRARMCGAAGSLDHAAADQGQAVQNIHRST
jgi:hypothetical protein